MGHLKINQHFFTLKNKINHYYQHKINMYSGMVPNTFNYDMKGLKQSLLIYDLLYPLAVFYLIHQQYVIINQNLVLYNQHYNLYIQH